MSIHIPKFMKKSVFQEMSPKNRTRNKCTVVLINERLVKIIFPWNFLLISNSDKKCLVFPYLVCHLWRSTWWYALGAEMSVDYGLPVRPNSEFLSIPFFCFLTQSTFFQLLFFREINVCFENTWKTEKNTDTHGPSTAADACPPGFLFWHLAFSDMAEK